MKRFFILLLFAGTMIGVKAQNMNVRWHDETNDTTKIVMLLSEASQESFATPSARVAWFGRKFIGVPYEAHTLEGTVEDLTVNLDSIDCTTFIDTALALAATSAENRLGWQDYVYNLRNMRYRNGIVNGYASRLHYNCDWATDNIHRGNIVDITPNFEKCKYMVRTIDFMTSHRNLYQSLKDDDEQYARIRSIEEGYRNHRFPYIKTSDLDSKQVLEKLREGDVLGFVSNLKDLDTTHMGMVIKGDDGKLHVLHASMSDGKTEISALPLPAFVKRNSGWIGVRIYRLAQ